MLAALARTRSNRAWPPERAAPLGQREEVHPLTVYDDDEMIAFFYTGGVIIYTDEDDKVVHVEGNTGLTQFCREYLEELGLGAGFVNNFIR